MKKKIEGFPQLKVTLLSSPLSQNALHEKEEQDGGYPANSHSSDVRNSIVPRGSISPLIYELAGSEYIIFLADPEET